MGMSLFVHSIRLVFSHLHEALRISGLIYISLSLAYGIAKLTFPNPSTSTGIPWWMLPAPFIAIPLYLWIAVGWHRFILLDEQPNIAVPRFVGDRILAYFGYSFLVGLILFGVGFIFGFVFFFLTALAQGSELAASGSMLLLMVASLVCANRLAPLLPASAIGRSISVGTAWAATSKGNGAIIVLSLLSAVAAFVVDLPANLLVTMPSGAILALIWLTITGWLKLMVGASILTTIYGHYVEGRPIGGIVPAASMPG